ncbi:hypothetical protein AAFF27_06490 [Xylophilus sp. GW821-FHT01B05]
MTISTTKAANTARNVSDNLLHSAENAVDSTRDFANDSLDKAGDKVREMRSNVDPLVNQITATAQELASRGREYAADAKYRAQQKLSHYTDATGRYVAEQPVRSVLIAVAAGAAIAAAILIATRDNKRNRY